MRRRFRFGRHELDLTIDTGSNDEAQKPVELPDDAEVTYSSTRSWSFGSVDDDGAPAADRGKDDAPLDVVSADPFRARNLLLIPSALFIGLGVIGQDNSGWFWLFAILGFAGIAAWQGLRRWEKRR
jgi:hypothetical protein